jgi:diguanylate cyclase (GGDEF)-like protein/PAS domain S-box-containing protein
MTRLEPDARTEDARRLEALEAYGIMDTSPEGEFDEIVALAARLCGVPASTITFVDAERQWFKARVGIGLDETPRAIAFCAYTVRDTEPLLVEDARRDPRFADNPLVTGEPRIVFYAGFPLVSAEGTVVGTLTAIDWIPRRLSGDQEFAMRVLAHQVVARLELRRALHASSRAEVALSLARSELEVRVRERTEHLKDASAAQARAERLYSLLWETITDAGVIMDERSVIEFANPGVERILGWAPCDLVGQPLAVLQPERFRAGHDAAMARYMATGEKRLDWRATEIPALHREGHEVPVEIAFSEVQFQHRRLFVGLMRDIGERKRAQEQLFRARDRAQATLRAIGDGVATVDAAGRVVYLNPVAEQLTGWTAAEADGRPVAEVLALADESNGTPLPVPMLEPGGASRPLPATAILHGRTGGSVSVEGSIAALRAQDGGHAGWVVAFRDVSASRRMAQQLSHQASHDALTGLVNRTEFDRRLRAALDSAVTRGRQHSLLYLDLDQFKVVNDTCGHIAGDELLKQLSSMLAMQLRGSDTLARLGGDEFGVLIEGCEPAPAARLAEKLRRAVADFNFAWDGHLFPTSVSIGQVNFHDHGLTVSEILSKADEACYLAKDSGRNRVHTYTPGDEVLARRHGEMEWIERIRQAMDEDRMQLYAQPIVAVADPSAPPLEWEVLLRMRERDGQIVPPMAFIPAAERYNLMPAVDRWVVRALFAHAAARADAVGDTRTCFAINLSAATLGDPAFVDFVKERLWASQVAPARICFEITETAAIGNFAAALKLIQDLRALGCRFALDDFGSGMSSFAYLKHLPVDTLKIDGAFVRGIAVDPVARAMVGSINEIGHLMGLRTIAEFVEDDAILAELRGLGVDAAQGFGLGAPAPL